MRFSTVLAVLLIGALLYLVMALIRAVAIGRMEGMQDEALAYRRKAWRAAHSTANSHSRPWPSTKTGSRAR